MGRPIGYLIAESAMTTKAVDITDTNSRRVVGTGTLQDMDVENRNGRIYAKIDLEPEIRGARLTELITTGNMKGEDGHPASKELSRQQTIDPQCVCVKYTKIWVEGNDIKATFKGTNNDLGAAFDQDLRDGELPSFSLRALGTIDNKAGKAYVKNIKVITWDRVYYPSHKRAYTSGLVTESADINANRAANQRIFTENDKGIILPITNEEVIDMIKKESCNLNRLLDSFTSVYESIDYNPKTNMVQLRDRFGNLYMVHVENYIQDQIMKYC